MTDPLYQPLQQAAINWQEDHPLSAQCDDESLSRINDLAEADAILLQGNQLADRWKNLKQTDFTIAETCFDSGLNFLAAQQLWLETTTTGTLHYISAQLYPLSIEDMQRTQGLWPSLSHLSEALLQHYPNPVPGIHRIHLPQHRTRLTLLYGDACKLFGSLRQSDHPAFCQQNNAQVDAWFLDGLAPANNPELGQPEYWTPELLTNIAQLSKPEHTTFSTFSAANTLQNGLKAAGFEIEKAPGFGTKRKSLRGKLLKHTPPEIEKPSRRKKLLTPPWHISNKNTGNQQIPRSVAVIGAGIAGCSTANALARRGIRVTLIDQHADIAQEGSGNPQGILFPRLSLRMGLLSRFSLSALNYALNFYRPIWKLAEDNPAMADNCGVILLPETDKQQSDFQRMAELYPSSLVSLLDNRQLQSQSGINLSQPTGLYFPQSGWINPFAVCSQLIHSPLITRRQATVGQLIELGFNKDGQSSSNSWQLLDTNENLINEADAVVITCANASKSFAQTRHLPLKPVRGQVTAAPANENSRKLKTVICGEGYLAPVSQNRHTFGASYNLGATSLEVTQADHQANLEKLSSTDPALGELFSTVKADTLTGRAAFRATTPDYLPIAGPVPNQPDFIERYAALRRDAKADIPHTANYHPGLYLNCGHGSRGMTYAPLCAEVLASQISQQFSPLERDLICAIHPARYLLRGLKKNIL